VSKLIVSHPDLPQRPSRANPKTAASPPELVAELVSGPPPELVAELTRLRAKYGDVVFQAAVTALPEKTGLLLLAERTKRRGPGRPKINANAHLLQMAFLIAGEGIAPWRAAKRVLIDTGVPEHRLDSDARTLQRKFREEGGKAAVARAQKILKLVTPSDKLSDALTSFKNAIEECMKAAQRAGVSYRTAFTEITTILNKIPLK
jgi:hypothetical protein